MSLAELAFFIGVALIATGTGWIYQPAGLIVAGLAFLFVAYGTARAERLVSPPPKTSKEASE